jgi:hypothetical protein
LKRPTSLTTLRTSRRSDPAANYNAHAIKSILKDVAPELGWR